MKLTCCGTRRSDGNWRIRDPGCRRPASGWSPCPGGACSGSPPAACPDRTPLLSLSTHVPLPWLGERGRGRKLIIIYLYNISFVKVNTPAKASLVSHLCYVAALFEETAWGATALPLILPPNSNV